MSQSKKNNWFKNILPQPKHSQPAEQFEREYNPSNNTISEVVSYDQWKDDFLNVVLRIGSVIFLLVIIATVSANTLATNISYAILLTALAIAAFARVTYSIRAFVFLASLFISSTNILLIRGIQSEAGMIFLGLITLAALLYEERVEFAALGLVAVTILTTAVLSVNGKHILSGWAPLGEETALLMVGSWADWIIYFADVTAIGLILIFAIRLLKGRFNRLLDEAKTSIAELSTAHNELKLHVAERTTDLEIARQESENHVRKLQSISEISKIISGEQKIESLLPLVTRLVSEQFNVYCTGMYLLDDTGQFVVLHAASNEGGKTMLAKGRKFMIGEDNIISYVAKSGTPRIALDVGLNAVLFNNPDLPGTRSQMAIPLRARNQIVGVLDLQSEKPGAYTENDANTFGILADQVAIAIENARLITNIQQALNEAQVFYRQSSKSGWLSFIREEPIIGYHQSLKGGMKLTSPLDTNEIRQVMNRGEALVFNGSRDAQDPAIIVPIKLRGQIIGTFNIKSPVQDRRWSSDEINLVEIISERLSLALENARLIQDSQNQVIKEQTISEVTGKIGASINLRNVLQTAVEELGRAIPGSDVVIEFKQLDENAEPSS